MSITYKPDWTRLSTSTGYRVVYCPDHPKAWSTGYVYVHRIVAEQKLGRLLRPGEIVHHRDGNRLNNSPPNIEVLSQSEHARHHANKGQTVVRLQCRICGAEVRRRKGKEPAPKRGKHAYCSRACAGKGSWLDRRRLVREHGTEARYRDGCRCDRCRAAHAVKMRKYRANSGA